MDIFKLLSRSTKLRERKPTNVSAVVPSSGQTLNPQLFGDHDHDNSLLTGDSVFGKRKREAQKGDGIPAEIDFFGSASTKEKRSVEVLLRPKPAVVEKEEDKPLDIDDCKGVLRSHKIKITVLSKEQDGHAEPKVKKDKSALGYTQPLLSFNQLHSRYGVRRKALQNILDQDYTVPTEIQLSALPLLLGERLIIPDRDREHVDGPFDLLAVAPTGSGKTLAFLIPVIRGLLAKKAECKGRRDGPGALIVVPTKELASQIANEARKLTLNTGLRVSLIRKGMRVGEHADHSDEELQELQSESSEDQEQEAESTTVKSDIIVTTPLSLLHGLQNGTKRRRTLPSVQHLVLDEADVLLDPLFRDQTLPIWRACASPSLRTTLWSATMPSSVESLAASILAERSTPAPLLRLIVGLKDAPLPTLTHTLTYCASEQGKLLALRQLLHPVGPTSGDETAGGAGQVRPPFLVFVQTTERAAALHAELRRVVPASAGGAARVATLHSGGSRRRAAALARVRAGTAWVLVATDVLARGVDVRGLNGVVNYDVPASAAAYVHRAGRTGRAGRAGGVVVTLFADADVPALRPVAEAVRAGGGDVPGWLMDALPRVGKRERKVLKRRGVEVRRPGGLEAGIGERVPGGRRGRGGRAGAVKRRGGAKGGDDEEESEFEGFG